MNGCSDPAMWAARTDYIEAFIAMGMRLVDRMPPSRERCDHEYIFRLAAAQIWDREIDEYLTCRC